MRSVQAQHCRLYTCQGVQSEESTHDSSPRSTHLGSLALRAKSEEGASNGTADPKQAGGQGVYLSCRGRFPRVSVIQILIIFSIFKMRFLLIIAVSWSVRNPLRWSATRLAFARYLKRARIAPQPSKSCPRMVTLAWCCASLSPVACIRYECTCNIWVGIAMKFSLILNHI